MSTAAHAAREPLLSVVITVYNLEHYIRECLESVLRQAHLDQLEVIVVDDGSTDRSRAEIAATLAGHPGCRVHVMTQANQGVSAARNLGIAHAQAPYLAFIDGDDLWAADFSAQVMPLLRAGTLDLVEFNIDVVSDSGQSVDALHLIAPGSGGARALDALARLEFVETYEAFVWARVYRRSLWAGIAFPIGRHYEDNATLPLLYLRARSTHRLEGLLYLYRRRGGSITNVATLGAVRDLARNAEEALSRSGSADTPAEREFWLRFFYKSFAHACSQNERVNGASFAAAARIVRELAAQHRAFLAREHAATPRRSLDGHARQVRMGRAVFLAKRAVKRLIGREIKPRARLPMAAHGAAAPSAGAELAGRAAAPATAQAEVRTAQREH
jgi:glycosyltransferase involved in cell wall biosynthesis